MLTRRSLRRVLICLLAIAILLAGVMAGAWATTDHFYISRIIAWREGSFRDFATKFHARAVPKGHYTFSFKGPSGDPPPWLRTVTYVRGVPASATPRESMTAELDSLGGTPVTEPLDTFLAETGTTAFLVIRDDTLLYERYFNGYTHDSPQTSFSVAKSFVSALVGIVISTWHIDSINDPMVTYIPELTGRGMDTITIQHLLTMSSGLRYSGTGSGGGPFGDDAKTYYHPNLRQLALTVRPESAPGSGWQYNNYHPLLLGLILERATHRPVATYLSEKLWQPLGMEADGSWSIDSTVDGFEKLESGLNARAIDFAKFGRLYLNAGSWSGVQVVPADWVEESTRVDMTTDPADFYQYLWWVDIAQPYYGRFLARGNLGQFIYVVPDKRLVIVRFGERFGYTRWPALLRSIAEKAP